MTLAEERFIAIKDKYLIAYKKNNHKKVYNVWFEKGWVYLQTCEEYNPSKHRISQFEKMCESLEARLNEL
jgi:hypothetical protein